MPVNITHPIAKTVPKISDHFVRSVTGRRGVATVLDQREFGLTFRKYVISPRVDRRIKFRWAARTHEYEEKWSGLTLFSQADFRFGERIGICTSTGRDRAIVIKCDRDRKSTRLNSSHR